MTAREHLQLFAGLKQVPVEQADQEILDRLKDVDLLDDADNLAGLSQSEARLFRTDLPFREF